MLVVSVQNRFCTLIKKGGNSEFASTAGRGQISCFAMRCIEKIFPLLFFLFNLVLRFAIIAILLTNVHAI